MKSDQINNAINNLWLKRVFHHGDEKLVVACLVRSDDWRPLRAPWWRGKEVSIIGADLNGNFFLRHCDGTVRYWNHSKQNDEIIAPSVIAFISGLCEDNNA